MAEISTHCKMLEPCEHVYGSPSGLQRLRSIAKACGVEKPSKDVVALCKQMRRKDVPIDKDNSCVIFSNCTDPTLYSVAELRAIAQDCDVDVKHKRSRSQLCDALYSEAFNAAPKIYVKKSNGERLSPEELEQLKLRVQELRDRAENVETRKGSLSEEHKTALEAFLRSRCAIQVFPKQERRRVLEQLHSRAYGQGEDALTEAKQELAQTLLAKLHLDASLHSTLKLPSLYPVLPIQSQGVSYQRAARAVAYMYFHDLWPKLSPGAEDATRRIVNEFILNSAPRLVKKNPFLRAHFGSDLRNLRQAAVDFRSPHHEETMARRAFAHALEVWCESGRDKVPELDAEHLERKME